MDNLKKQILDKAEELGWTIEESTLEHDRLCWEFYKTTPAGEDFGFLVAGSTLEELVKDVCSYCEGFDAEEHAASWAAYFYGKSGSLNLRVLLNDAEKIDDMLNDLATALDDTVNDWYLEHEEE